MQIFNIRPLGRRVTERGNVQIARFNIRLTDDITLFDWLLQEVPDGTVGAYPPLAGHGHVTAAISRRARAAIGKAVLREMNEAAHERAA